MTNAGLNIPPYTGSEFLRVELTGGLRSAISTLGLSASAATVPLNNGCFLQLGSPIFNTGQVVSAPGGNATIGPFPLPDDPIFFIDRTGSGCRSIR